MVGNPRRNRQSGQAAVLIALSLFSMVVFLAMASNTGILVNERIRIQNSADLAAYSGAFAQATRMNDMAYVNDIIRQVSLYCRWRLTRGIGPNFLGKKNWNKTWDQCRPEDPPPFDGSVGDMLPEFPGPGKLTVRAPKHALLPIAPNKDTPSWIPRVPGFPYPRYGATHECNSEGDSRANDFINWCERTMNYYAQVIYDLNDYGAAYQGQPQDASYYSLFPGNPRPIERTVQKTAQLNYPKATARLIDKPSSSPVHNGHFYQQSVTVTSDPIPNVGWFAGGGMTDGYVDDYERHGGPSMAPLRRYEMNFNYVYFCCAKIDNRRCGPEACGLPGGNYNKFRNVGHVYGALGRAHRKLMTTFFMPGAGSSNRGMVYLPVEVEGDPRLHNVPILDINRNAGGSYFGGHWNGLSATAVAKPYDGFIGPSEDQMDGYEVNVPEDPPIILPRALEGVYTSEGLTDMEQDDLIPHSTYRARMAGFREPIVQEGGTTLLDVLVQDKGDPTYGYTTH